MKFTLDNIRAEADKKYGMTEIEVDGVNCRLLNPLQLSKEKRAELEAVQERLEKSDDSDEDVADVIAAALRVVAKTEREGDALIDGIGDNLALLVTVFETYNGKEEAGEASPSAA